MSKEIEIHSEAAVALGGGQPDRGGACWRGHWRHGTAGGQCHGRFGLAFPHRAMRVAGSPLVKKLINNGFARASHELALPSYRG